MSKFLADAMTSLRATALRSQAHPTAASPAANQKAEPVKKTAKTSKPTKAKRNGIFKAVNAVLKKETSKTYSVKQLANAIMKKHPGKDFRYYAGVILQTAAWCKRNDVKCAKLTLDHRAAKPVAKKVVKDPLA